MSTITRHDLLRIATVALLVALLLISLLKGIQYDAAIDLSSGDVRQTTSMFGLILHQKIRPTRFSSQLRKCTAVLPSPRWVRVHTSWLVGDSPSPHYTFHDAINVCEEVVRSLELSSKTDRQKCEIILQYAGLLKKGDVASLHNIVEKSLDK